MLSAQEEAFANLKTNRWNRPKSPKCWKRPFARPLPAAPAPGSSWWVTDTDLLTKLASSRPGGSGFFKGAPLAIAVCADPSKSAPWIEDCTIAALTIQYAAQALGLGS